MDDKMVRDIKWRKW